MKLLQTLVEAVNSKAKLAAKEILADGEKIASLARGSVSHLKKTFGEKLMDTPMALITQHVRTYVDATLSMRLNKDDLEMVTHKVVSALRPYLNESAEEADEDSVEEAAVGEMWTVHLQWRDKDGKSWASGNYNVKAPTKEKAKSYAIKDREKKGYKEVSATRATPGKAVKESVIGIPGQEKNVETVFHLILAEEIDAEEVLTQPEGPMQRKAAKTMQSWFDHIAGKEGLDPDHDFESIMLTVYELIEQNYGEAAGKSPFEESADPIRSGDREDDDDDTNSDEEDDLTEAARRIDRSKWYIVNAQQEVVAGPFDSPGEATRNMNDGTGSDDGWEDIAKGSELMEGDLTEATRGRPRKNPPKEAKVPGKRGRPAKNAAKPAEEKKPAPKKDDDEDDEQGSAKNLAKSMEDDSDEDDEDAKRADAAAKDKPKKIADTSVKPEQLKDANKKLSKQIQSAMDSYSVKSAFELTKKLRADFPDITSDQLKQASAIWKSENQ